MLGSLGWGPPGRESHGSVRFPGLARPAWVGSQRALRKGRLPVSRNPTAGVGPQLPPTFFRLQGKLILHTVLPFQAGCGDPALLFCGADEPPTWK